MLYVVALTRAGAVTQGHIVASYKDCMRSTCRRAQTCRIARLRLRLKDLTR